MSNNINYYYNTDLSLANVDVRGHIRPDSSGLRDLGATGSRFRTLYTVDVSVSGNIYSTTTATPLIFAQNTAERMRVTASGQLQVATATISTGAIKISTPTQNQNQTTFIGFSGDGSDGNDRARVGCKFGSAGGGNLFFTTGGSGSQKERIFITEGGQVQVGNSTDPNSGIILYNNSTVNETRAISNSVLSNEICGLSSAGSNHGQLRLSAGGNTSVGSKVYIDMFAASNNVMIFGTKGAERMRIDTNEFVGVGIAAPEERLHIGGNLKVNGNIIPDNDTRKIGTSNTNRFLEGWFGTVYGNGVTLTSDRRLKDNIKPITNALETIMKMKPVEYKMKDRVRLHTGFIADELKNLYNGEDWAVFVEAQDEFKTQCLQYTEIVAVLTSALQEVNNRLSTIESRKLVGSDVIVTNEIQKPQLDMCVEISRINELFERISNLSTKLAELESQIHCNESKSNSSEDFELVHSLMDRNHHLELRVNELSTKLAEYENKLNNLPKVEAKNEIEDSDTGRLSMIESLQDRLFKAEQLAIKQDKMIKKLTTAVNKFLKQSE